MSDTNQLSDGRPAGTQLGQDATDVVGFFGATPVVKQIGPAVPTDLATSITAITAIRLALINLGLVTTV